MTNTRRSILGALAALWPAVALGKGGDDTTDDTSDDGGPECQRTDDCPAGRCIDGHCVSTEPPPGGGPGGCDGAESPLECCREAVKRGCRRGGGGQVGHGHGGGHCRRRGFARCRQNFPV